MNLSPTSPEATQSAVLAAPTRRDYIVPLRDLVIEPAGDGGRPVVSTRTGYTPDGMRLSRSADAQLATMLGIGAGFSLDCSDRFPDTWAEVLRQYLGDAPSHDVPAGRIMLRTDETGGLDGGDGYAEVGGIVSSSYLRMDARMLAWEVSRFAADLGWGQSGVLDRGWMKFIAKSPNRFEVFPGDDLTVALRVYGDDYGRSKLAAELALFRLICSNGATVKSADVASATREHRGSRRTDFGLLPEIQPHEQDAVSIWLDQFRTVATACRAIESGGAWVDQLRQSADARVADAVSAWQVTAKAARLSITETAAGWRNFIGGGTSAPGTAWALGNAVTFVANSRAGQSANLLEDVGGAILQQGGVWPVASVTRLPRRQTEELVDLWNNTPA